MGFNTSDEIEVYGAPYGEDQTRYKESDVIREALARNHPDLVFLQMSPENFIARQRFLSQKSALKDIEGYNVKSLTNLNPDCPLSFQECIVNLSILDMLDQNTTFDKIDLTMSYYAYSYEEVQHKDYNKVIKRDQLVKSITSNIVGKSFSPYSIINEALYQCLMGKQKVLLGEISETLYRQILANSLSLDDLKDIFKFVGNQLTKIIVPMSYREAAYNFLP